MFYGKIILCLNSFTISTNERAVQVLILYSSVFFFIPSCICKYIADMSRLAVIQTQSLQQNKNNAFPRDFHRVVEQSVTELGCTDFYRALATGVHSMQIIRSHSSARSHSDNNSIRRHAPLGLYCAGFIFSLARSRLALVSLGSINVYSGDGAEVKHSHAERNIYSTSIFFFPSTAFEGTAHFFSLFVQLCHLKQASARDTLICCYVVLAHNALLKSCENQKFSLPLRKHGASQSVILL